MPMAIGRSKLGPSFLTSAGARLIVVRPRGTLNPEFERAVPTRSRDSFTAASGSPTMTIMESPQPAFTSTSIGYASIPFTAEEKTRDSMGALINSLGRKERKRVSKVRHYLPYLALAEGEPSPERTRKPQSASESTCYGSLCYD